jgi:hypothetical protein
MAELNLISVSEGPDLQVDDVVEDRNFESLLADEVVVEWLQSLESANQLQAVK